MEDLVHQRLMLIAIETITNQLTELRLGSVSKLGLDRLTPQFRGTLEMHLSYPNPHGLLNSIHSEMFLTQRTPQMRAIDIEGWERQLRQTTQGVWIWGRWRMPRIG